MFRDANPNPAPDQDNELAARGIPQVGRKRKGNKYMLLFAVGCCVVFAIAMGSRAMLDKLRHRGEAKAKEATMERGLPDLTRSAFDAKNAPPPPPDKPGAPAPATSTGLTAQQKAAMDLAERRKRAPLLSMGGAKGGATQSNGNGALTATAGGGGVGGGSSLSRALSATRTVEVSASQLTDPDLTLTQGSFLDCTLVTAINSQMPGMTSCTLSRNIYSTNGRVLLLERGTRIVGQYQSAQLRQGMDRIFVLWTRAETPNGVVINLDSPNADSLGRSGLEGKINHHFWQRFGAALLVSVVDDAAQYAVNSRSRNGSTNNNFNFNSTGSAANDAASIIVESTVNIPPTLDRAQGGSVGIFVARDLYFGSVYSLSPTTANP
ncbi:type IV secretion system protein VirB10 [Dyella sp.]|uniref:type IV secretion system protein VirB10 n=1 Tax=Dyella sp. TaxID=1869338 RepID=UPI002ED2EFCE